MLLTSALVLTLAAGGLDSDKAAKIAFEQQKAFAAIDKKYGNKQPSELTREERVDIVKERAEAEQKTLDKYDVSAKDWARYQATQSPDERKQLEADTKKLADKEQEEAAKKNAPAGNGEIQIQRGFSDDNPVVMDEKGGAGPRVDTGIPLSEQDDAMQGTEAGGGGPMPPTFGEDTPKSKSKSKKKSKRHR